MLKKSISRVEKGVEWTKVLKKSISRVEKGVEWTKEHKKSISHHGINDLWTHSLRKALKTIIITKKLHLDLSFLHIIKNHSPTHHAATQLK